MFREIFSRSKKFVSPHWVHFLPFLHLYCVLPIDTVAGNIIILFLLHGDARSLIFFVWLLFFWPTTLYRDGEKPSECCTLLLPTAGIKLRPPAQQASVLSITPLPLGRWAHESCISLKCDVGHLTTTNVRLWRQQLGINPRPLGYESNVPIVTQPIPLIRLVQNETCSQF